MMKQEPSLFAAFPWTKFPWSAAPFGVFPNLAAVNVEPNSALAPLQRYNQACGEAIAAALQGFQAIALKQAQLIQTRFSENAGEMRKAGGTNFDWQRGIAAYQEAVKNCQDYGNIVLVEKAQQTSAKAWDMLYKRLAEGVKDWDTGAQTWASGVDMPNAVKEIYERAAADSGSLCDVVHNANANALALMQKRFSAAITEMKDHFPSTASARGTEQLEEAAKCYEHAASSISDTLLRANTEAFEALQAWSIETMKSAGQKAA